MQIILQLRINAHRKQSVEFALQSQQENVLWLWNTVKKLSQWLGKQVKKKKLYREMDLHLKE